MRLAMMVVIAPGVAARGGSSPASPTPPPSSGNVADLEWKIRGAGDFDGDGQTDLVWQHASDGAVAIWLMNGTALRSVTALTPSSVTDASWWLVSPR